MKEFNRPLLPYPVVRGTMEKIMKRSLAVAAVLISMGLLSIPRTSEAQFGRIKDKIKAKVEGKVDQKEAEAEGKVDAKIDDSLDGVSNALSKILDGKKSCDEVEDDDDKAKCEQLEKKKAAKQAQEKRAQTQAAGSAANAGGAASPPVDAAAWANFDFVPGEKILFADDLGADRVGNFPQRWELVKGTAEIVEWNGKRWLRAVSDPTRVDIVLPAALPPRFTVEFDLNIREDRLIYQSVALVSGRADDIQGDADGGSTSLVAALPRSVLVVNRSEAGLLGGGADARKAYTGATEGSDNDAHKTRILRVRVQADGKYVKAYVDQDRIANVPSANLGRTNRIRFSLNGTSDGPVLIGNIVVAAGGSSFYDALLTNGRVATQGILFDTGSDRIKPESFGTLKQIGDMLKEHADLKLMIEGHTDNVGNSTANDALSHKRAAAVKQALASQFGVDAGRLTSTGFGDTKPAVPNTTAEGRQQNRRVELVKM